MNEDQWLDHWGIVRHGRWLAWGMTYGVVVRPRWLARAIVKAWNWLSCHALGHEWFPDITVTPTAGKPDVRLTGLEICANCSARRQAPGGT